jgi:hypothetical protein
VRLGICTPRVALGQRGRPREDHPNQHGCRPDSELALVTFFRDNINVFAWQPSQMPGISREVIEHYLKIYPDARPVQQKPWMQSVEWQNFIHEEIKKLLDAGFIREVHPWCLTNLVVVCKAGGKIRMCIRLH